MDHTMLARVLQKNAELLAISIEIDGMKAANMERQANGEALAYPEAVFNSFANDASRIASELFQLSY